MLSTLFLEQYGESQSAFARRIGVSFVRLHEIVKGKRGVTPDTALRLARATGTSPEFWMNLQQKWDLWHALRAPAAKEIENIEPLVAA